MDKKLIAVEENLYQMKFTGRGQDFARWPCKLYGRIPNLAGEISESDFPPTISQLEVHKMYKEEIGACQNQLNKLINTSLPALNDMLKDKDLPIIIAVAKTN